MKKTNFKYKHSLGQNFIVDEFLLDDICDNSNLSNDDYILEIGPGNGALTISLLPRVKYVVSVEVDKSLMRLLTENLSDYENKTIINADFMNLDFDIILNEFIRQGFNENVEHIKVVANLPYYITSHIINKLLFNPYISEMTLMVQKEVANRIVSSPSSKDYGILTLACKYFADTEILFYVPKTAFYPVPQVDSAVVHFTKHKNFIDVNVQKNFEIENDEDYKNLFYIIKAAFTERRKKLLNSLSDRTNFSKDLIAQIFKKLNFDELVRAENLSLDDYKNLARLLFNPKM